MASKSQRLHKRKLVLVGKTGVGKSSLANTIFEEEVFEPNYSPSSETVICKCETKEVMNTELTLVDTPGLFDTGRSEDDLKSEIIRSITECDPGPHAILILLKVGTYTKEDEEVVTKIFQYFTEEVLKYCVIVFTYGDQLHKNTTIQEFVDQNRKLKDLVRRCSSRCHVFDSKHWKSNDSEEYRSNSNQLKDLLNTVEDLVDVNSCYTIKMLEEKQRQCQREGADKRPQVEENNRDETLEEKPRPKEREDLADEKPQVEEKESNCDLM